jgi:hypothetical protein
MRDLIHSDELRSCLSDGLCMSLVFTVASVITTVPINATETMNYCFYVGSMGKHVWLFHSVNSPQSKIDFKVTRLAMFLYSVPRKARFLETATDTCSVPGQGNPNNVELCHFKCSPNIIKATTSTIRM